MENKLLLGALLLTAMVMGIVPYAQADVAIDNFEGYADTTALKTEWNEWVPQGIHTYGLGDSNGVGNSNAMYTSWNPNGTTNGDTLMRNPFSGTYSSPLDWMGETGIRLWIKPGTITDSNFVMEVRWNEDMSGSIDQWTSQQIDVTSLDPNGEYVFLPFSDFYDENAVGDGIMVQTCDVFYVGWHYNGTAPGGASAEAWVDNIAAVDVNLANNPSPTDGQIGVDPNMVLSWLPGMDANSHDVYFGTDFYDVNDANTSDLTGIYKGAFDANSYDPNLEYNTTYYWRIDEVNDTNVWRGNIWNFTTTEPACNPPLPGDTNDDCVVDNDDLRTLSSEWLLTGEWL